MITDFDSAFDMTLKRDRLEPEDFRGTPKYMAPEVSTRQEISFKCDIFSLSLNMSVMALGFNPHYGNRYISDELISTWVRDVGGSFQKQLEHFLKACPKINPNDRPNIDDIKH